VGSWYFFFFFASIGVWTPGLALATQVLYLLSHSPALSQYILILFSSSILREKRQWNGERKLVHKVLCAQVARSHYILWNCNVSSNSLPLSHRLEKGHHFYTWQMTPVPAPSLGRTMHICSKWNSECGRTNPSVHTAGEGRGEPLAWWLFLTSVLHSSRKVVVSWGPRLHLEAFATHAFFPLTREDLLCTRTWDSKLIGHVFCFEKLTDRKISEQINWEQKQILTEVGSGCYMVTVHGSWGKP
jgi:hypothetical protein